MEKKFGRLNSKQRIAFLLISIIPICMCVLVLRIVNVRLLFSWFSGIWCLSLMVAFVLVNYFVIRTKMVFVEKLIILSTVFMVTAVITFFSMVLTKNIIKVDYYDENALNYYNENLLDEPVFLL